MNGSDCGFGEWFYVWLQASFLSGLCHWLLCVTIFLPDQLMLVLSLPLLLSLSLCYSHLWPLLSLYLAMWFVIFVFTVVGDRFLPVSIWRDAWLDFNCTVTFWLHHDVNSFSFLLNCWFTLSTPLTLRLRAHFPFVPVNKRSSLLLAFTLLYILKFFSILLFIYCGCPV